MLFIADWDIRSSIAEEGEHKLRLVQQLYWGSGQVCHPHICDWTPCNMSNPPTAPVQLVNQVTGHLKLL